MPSFIGVRSLHPEGPSKRDLLLFDQIAVFDLDLVGFKSSQIADIEWLQDKGLLWDIDSELFYQWQAANNAERWMLLHVAHGLFRALFGLVPEATDMADRWTKLAHTAYHAYRHQHLAGYADYIERVRKTRAVPLDSMSAYLPLERVKDQFETILQGFGEKKDLIQSGRAMLLELETKLEEHGINRTDLIDLLMETYTNASGLKEPSSSCVLEIVTEALPLPGDDVPWEQIWEFRSDERTQYYVIKLREWMRSVSKLSSDPREIREEMEGLIADYQDHMRFHRMQIQTGIVKTLITTTAEIAENLAKLHWGKAAQALFNFQEKKVLLTEAERKAPGRELAYIVAAGRKFGPHPRVR